jgi:hypothetical protein
MGFGFKIKLPSLKKLGKTLLYSAMVGPGAGEMMGAFPKLDEGMTEIGKGVGNLVTGGYISQKAATEQAKKASEDAEKRYAAEQAAAAETARKIAETEEERKRRLAAQGTQMPSTLSGSYLGIPGRVSQSRSLLG